MSPSAGETSRSIQFDEHGSAEVLRLASMTMQPLLPDAVRVAHTAIGVNYSDINVRRGGFYRSGPAQYPSGIGNDAVGVVAALGAHVTGLAVGDRVGYVKGRGAFWSDLGSYADMRDVPANRLVKVPVGLTDDQAAAVLLKGLTAATLVMRVHPPVPGEVALVHAAASGVGLLLTQWLSHSGVEVIGTVGSAEKAEMAQRHGAHRTILYREQPFASRVRDWYPKGVDVVFDSVGKDTFLPSLDVVRRYGAVINFGNASGRIPPFDLMTLAAKGSVWINRTGVEVDDVDFYRGALAEVFQRVDAGVLSSHVDRVFALSDARDAHLHLENGRSMGSVLLRP